MNSAKGLTGDIGDITSHIDVTRARVTPIRVTGVTGVTPSRSKTVLLLASNCNAVQKTAPRQPVTAE